MRYRLIRAVITAPGLHRYREGRTVAETVGIGMVGSTPVGTRMIAQCPERERLLSQWADSSNRLTKILDEQLAAMKSSAPSFAGFEDQIRLARAAETEACRKYFAHVNTHGCV
jgi:hypothetical protein